MKSWCVALFVIVIVVASLFGAGNILSWSKKGYTLDIFTDSVGGRICMFGPSVRTGGFFRGSEIFDPETRVRTTIYPAPMDTKIVIRSKDLEKLRAIAKSRGIDTNQCYQ